MCGIFGAVSLTGASLKYPGCLTAMARALAHRGPDGERLVGHDRASLGARRLAIMDLTTGDRLVLFTDGVTEVRNSFDEEFGEDRLLHILRSCRGLDGDKLQQLILQKVNDFCLGELNDDTTMVVLTVE